jgi:acid stress-induced BolA-like protein IbaG/YrbA
MTRSWLARRLGICLVLALLALLVPSMAQAQANVFRFEFQEPLTGSTSLPECLPPDLVGTQTGTETTVGQVTETGQTFQVHGTTTLEYRVVFPDGRYVVGTAVEHFSFIAAGPQTVNTTPIQERRTIYSAEGEPIGQVFMHAVSHVTFRDANGNGVPDPGEITASVDRFFFTCH